jgi:hypothetical protein
MWNTTFSNTDAIADKQRLVSALRKMQANKDIRLPETPNLEVCCSMIVDFTDELGCDASVDARCFISRYKFVPRIFGVLWTLSIKSLENFLVLDKSSGYQARIRNKSNAVHKTAKDYGT